MVQLLADRRDIEFVLHEQFDINRLSQFEKYADFNRSVIDMIVKEVRQLAIKEILPANAVGDKEGCSFENGRVKMPAVFKPAWEKLAQGEWFAPCQSPAWGGQGIPHVLNVMAQNYLFGANLSLLMVAGLNHAAGEIIETFGTDLQKKVYVKKLYTGEWSGTMLLTEAQSGSNLGDLTTTAVQNQDGTYCLSGGKVFISGGDQDITDNIVHLVLARVEGAPSGSKGISLFIAPKILVDNEGNLTDANDIICTGIEEKMGLHGSPTCTMALGSKGNCTATLVGEENRGLPIMFKMMNMARLMVGAQGLGCASAAFGYALDYASNRRQGTLPAGKDNDEVPIIRHPDVRRMLMTQKVYVEGARSLLCFIALMEDLKTVTNSAHEKERYQDLIDILIPVAKAYVTDRAMDVCSTAVQIFGGYGYTGDFPVAQLFRDVKITAIYEGTNGIQAMDLLARKLSVKKGQLFNTLMNEMEKTIGNAKAFSSLDCFRSKLESAMETYRKTASLIDLSAPHTDILKSLSAATPFLDVTGDLMMGWMMLWRSLAAQQALAGKIKKKDRDFYDGQLACTDFFYNSILPVTLGKMSAIAQVNNAAMQISDMAFGGK